MLAHAFLAVACAAERDTQPSAAGLIRLSVNEFRRLFDLTFITRAALVGLQGGDLRFCGVDCADLRTKRGP